MVGIKNKASHHQAFQNEECLSWVPNKLLFLVPEVLVTQRNIWNSELALLEGSVELLASLGS